LPQGVRPSDQAENNKTASRQRRNWLIKAASASKEIRLLLAPLSEEHPVSHGKPGRANNKNNRLSITIKNSTHQLGGSFGSPSSFWPQNSPPAALLHTFSRHDARIRSNHAVIVPHAVEKPCYGRLFQCANAYAIRFSSACATGRSLLQTVHPMLKKLFKSFRSPLRRAPHPRSTPEVLSSRQHPLKRNEIITDCP